MDEEEFTPGPWKVSERLETFYDFYEDCLTGLAVTTGGRDICHVWNASGGSLPYEANAALIAAAPAMYDALRWACFYNCKRPVMTANCEKCKINQALTMAGGEKWYRKVKNDDLRD